MMYHEYLRTPAWALTRGAAIRRAGFRCEECASDGLGRLQVHHLTYERLGRERLDDLRVLCGLCHATLHGKATANDRLRDAVAKNRELANAEDV